MNQIKPTQKTQISERNQNRFPLFLFFLSDAKTKNTMCLQRLENTNVESVLQNDFSRANWSGIK